MSSFPVLKPDLQVSLYARLQALRERYLIESLKKTVEAEDFELKAVDTELASYADAKNLKRIASFGLRGEVFFPVPYVLARNPFLLGYYRLLLGFSRKGFYEQGPFKRFDSLEDQGKVKDALESQLPDLCVSLSKSASMLVEWINPISIGIVNELQLLTLGAQFRGSGNVRLGQEAIDQFFNLLTVMLEPYKPTIKGRTITLKNDSKLPVEVRCGSDPDVCITQELKSQQRKLVAIEIKGGTDVSNVWNRLGEAEKSHQTARHTGFNELWTVLRVDVVTEPNTLKKAREKSPPQPISSTSIKSLTGRQTRGRRSASFSARSLARRWPDEAVVINVSLFFASMAAISNRLGQLQEMRFEPVRGQILDAEPNFSKGDDTGEQRLRIGGFKPPYYARVWLRPNELRNNVGIDQKPAHRSRGRG